MARETIIYRYTRAWLRGYTSIATANKELTNPKRIRSVERMNTPVDATHDGLYSVGAHQKDDCL